MVKHDLPGGEGHGNDDRVEQLLAEEHYRFLKVNLPISPIMALAVAGLFYRHTPLQSLIIGTASVFFFCLVGMMLVWNTSHLPAAQAIGRYAFSNLLGGISWGAFMVVAMPGSNAAQLYLGGLIPFGMAINMVEAASVKRSFNAFHIPFTVIAMLAFAIRGDGSAKWLPVVFAIAGIYTMIAARVAHQTSRDRAELTIRNLELIDDLNQANSDLAFQSQHDRLTGLPNRRALERVLTETFEKHGDPDRQLGEVIALFIDLDRFKDVNDTLGHDAGDELLKLVAHRLSALVDDSGFVARMGGDELVIVVEGSPLLKPADQLACAEELAGRIVGKLNEPFRLEQGSARVGASVGIAMTSPDCVSGTSLMRQADHALYDAKALGRNQYVTFVPGLHQPSPVDSSEALTVN